MKTKYLIIGAGPTGLGAAHRLQELGENDFQILERNTYAGGLSASFTDSAGFTWDIGGHVLFSHYDYFDRLLDGLMGDEFFEHQRECWIRSHQTWVPYPFQNNVRHLPPQPRWECVEGLLPGNRPEAAPRNFAEWIAHIFGSGIAAHFMLPYNFKVWATPPELMQFGWIGERVSVVDLRMVLRNIILELEDMGWGPNNLFRFPVTGGTGEIFRRLARTVEDRIRYGQSVVSVDAEAKTVRTAQGLEITYEHLLSTAPLDLLAGSWLAQRDDPMVSAANSLTHNSVYVAGVGQDITDPTEQNSRCWMYFPERNAPFYRVTNFHNYSPNNTARPGQQLSYMAETSFSPHKPEDRATLMTQTLDGLVNTSLMKRERRHDLAATWEMSVDYGYPVPCLRRDTALAEIQPRLEQLGVYSRGRFGGWKYEVGNMDHSVMQGVEWVNHVLTSSPEATYGGG